MKNLKKILIIFLFLLISIFLFLNISNAGLTGNTVLQKYSYTKAICTNSHCKDYLIYCNGKNLEKISPTGFTIESKNQENLNETLCN